VAAEEGGGDTVRDLFVNRKKIFLLAGGLGALAVGVMLAVSFWPEASYPVQRQIQYSFTLQNLSNQKLKNAEFWAHAPVRQTANQKCELLEVSHPYQLLSDELGNQTLYFRLSEMPPFGTLIVSVKATLSLADTPNRMPDIQPKAHIKPEPFCESGAPEIACLAASFISGKPAVTAEKIFNWVAANIQYSGYHRNERGALYALKNRQGDCTEFMYLFSALCRAREIPARNIGGFVCTGNTVVKPGEYHNWVELFDGKAWRIADPQRKVWMKNGSHYIAMRVIGETPGDSLAGFHRFRFNGEGLKVKMNS
jgi:transglutaminase-like putative cysteine protease